MAILLLIHIVILIVVGQNAAHPPVLIIVSFDGFRFDYLNKTDTPNFDRLVSGGVFSPTGIEPRYITKTFPNHHAIATGLYEESHGIVANNFFDPQLNDTFWTNDTDAKWWDTGAIPLWISNQLHDEGRFSGGSMWPGVETAFKNHTSTHVLPYNSTVDWNERVDAVIGWLTDEKQPANCVFMYFENPDSAGHEFGPDSPEVEQAIRKADNVTGYLISRLEQVKLFDSVNIIITSDHGMTSTPLTNHIDMNKFMDTSDFRYFGSSPVLNILPNPGKEDQVYEALVNASKSMSFKVYKKSEMPEEYHYKNNIRIMPIIVEAYEHFSISDEKTDDTLGNHGYNNSISSMRPFFVAHGPDFLSGSLVKSFRNIDIYPLACFLLEIDALPNNGSLQNIKHLLKSPPTNDIDQTVVIVVAVLLSSCLVAAVLAIVTVLRKHRKENRGCLTGNRAEEEQSLISS